MKNNYRISETILKQCLFQAAFLRAKLHIAKQTFLIFGFPGNADLTTQRISENNWQVGGDT